MRSKPTRRRTGRPPAIVTATDAVAKYGLTYKRIWDAQRDGLLHTYSGPSRDGVSFRAFMASEGLDHPDASWSAEDVEAWELDEGAPSEYLRQRPAGAHTSHQGIHLIASIPDSATMRWRSAEQLLGRLDDGLDRYVTAGRVESLATFDWDDREFSCDCAICRPDLAKRKRRSAAPAAAMIPDSDLEDVLAAMRPTLIGTARLQLQNRGLDGQLAEDLVQDAIVRWITKRPEYRGPRQLFGWLRKTISWLAAEGLRRRDLLDGGQLLSLDEPWARV